jgi:FkbM family methyltransferase
MTLTDPHVPARPRPQPARPAWLQHVLETAMDRLPFVEKEFLLMRRLVAPGAVCVDVGAAGGTYTHLLSRLAGPTGHVHAIEPRRGSVNHLRRLQRWLGWDNVTLHPLALSDRPGVSELAVPRWVRTEAHLRPSGNGHGPVRHELVTTTTLDELAVRHRLERLDLVTCDVEGAELRVLAGGRTAIRRFRPVVVCEIEARHLGRYGLVPDDVLAWFDSVAYRPHRFRGGRLRPVERVTDADNDYVLLPRERAVATAGGRAAGSSSSATTR